MSAVNVEQKQIKHYFLCRMLEDMCAACLNSMLDVAIELDEESDEAVDRGRLLHLLSRLGSLLLCLPLFSCMGLRGRIIENTACQPG